MKTETENLINLARDGDKESMDALSEVALPRIKSFLFRVTLNEDTAEDLTQETILQMVSSLDGLRNSSSFWPWLYRIAMNKANQHFRKSKKEPKTSIEDLKDRLGFQAESGEGLDSFGVLSRKELSEVIANSIQKLRSRHRALISMRCFEDMPYKHIAESLNCSELSARVAFVRAKRSLKKELARNGLKAAPLIAVLLIFGKATVDTSSAAEVSIATSSMESSLLAQSIGSVTVKKAAAVAAGTVIAAAGFMNLGQDTVILDKGVNSVHYIVQARNEKSRWGSLSKGAYEKWCYFPEGVDGPMILRMQRWDTKVENKLCSWLQDENGNHYYNTSNNTVYLLNERLGGFLEMPTDNEQMAAFIMENEPGLAGVKNERDRSTGMLSRKVDNNFEDTPDFETLYEYNDVDPEFFEPFWPADCKVQDLRTPMHKRGWTYFKIEGDIGDQEVSGTGRIPFYLSAARDNPAWLQIRIGGELKLIDAVDAAWVMDDRNNILGRFPAGSFLKGLARPWQGYNTLDTLRRDAAAMRIPFETFFNEDRSRAEVVLDTQRQGRNIAVVYKIDLILDLLESVSITARNEQGVREIRLSFNYLQDIENADKEFSVPSAPAELEAIKPQSSGLHWLIALASGEFGF